MDKFFKDLVDVKKPDMSEIKGYEETYEIYNYLPVINDILPVTSIFQKYISKYPKSNTLKLSSNLKNRIDLISKEIYGTPHLWWIICLYNNIIDPEKFDLNEVYYIPKINLLSIFDEFKGKYDAMNKVDLKIENFIG